MYLVPAACGHAALRPLRLADCLACGSWRADVGIGPYEKNHRTPARIGTRFWAADSRPYDGKRQRVHVGAD